MYRSRKKVSVDSISGADVFGESLIKLMLTCLQMLSGKQEIFATS
jgi:hypothetical protein